VDDEADLDGVAEDQIRRCRHALIDLRYHWGGAYEIALRGRQFRAARRDDGSVLHAASAEALDRAIWRDYQARPVPRDLPG
jgi:hypothetical protein